MYRQFYGCRIKVLPTHPRTVSQLLATNLVNYTPTSLYNTLRIGCHCGKSHISTPHCLHHVIMQPHHLQTMTLVPEHLLSPWRECMSNTTYTSPERSYRTVARSATNALDNV